ncbi:MAG: caspase family protein [Nostoc sp. TH1S01]|nr:caspase family protein [Nostoc sp. TH1S01]
MTKLALLIGVSEYLPGLSALTAPPMDVREVKRVLQHPEMGGFAEADIQQLLNPEPQKMQEAIETLFSDRTKNDLVLLYFSGHGIKDETGKLYLATSLTRKNSQGRLIKSTAVPASFVHNIMSESRSKRQVVILDCCFSGAFAEGWSAKDDGSVDIYTQLGGEGRVVLTSSTSTQYSFEQQGANLSTYTRYFVEGIETGAADTDNDGVISIDELHDYAKKKVKEAAPAMQPEIYAVKEGFKIRLAKAPIGDPKLRYRREVERFASRGVISAIGRSTLELKSQELGIQPHEAAAIEAEVLKPYQEYQKRLMQYEQMLTQEVKKQYPLKEDTGNELKAFQQALGLKDEDIQPILNRVLPQKTPPEIKPPKPIQPSIWNRIFVGLVILIFAGASSLIVSNLLIFVNDFQSQPSTLDTTSQPQPSFTADTSQPQPSQVPSGTARKSFCLQLKKSWEFFKKTSGEDNESIRASMQENNCSYWNIYLPKPGASSSSQTNINRVTIPSPSWSPNTLELPSLEPPKLTPLPKVTLDNSHPKITNLPNTSVTGSTNSRSNTTSKDNFDRIKTDTEKRWCNEQKTRYKNLFAEGAVSEEFIKNALNRGNCSEYGINWP